MTLSLIENQIHTESLYCVLLHVMQGFFCSFSIKALNNNIKREIYHTITALIYFLYKFSDCLECTENIDVRFNTLYTTQQQNKTNRYKFHNDK